MLVDLPGRDAIRDFLAKDDEALRVYESENADTQVTDQSRVSTLVADGSRYRIRQTTPMAGFIFIRLTDPLAGRQLVIRSSVLMAGCWPTPTHGCRKHGIVRP